MSGKHKDEAERIVDEAAGRLKETAGAATGDETLKAEERSEQRSSERKTYSVVLRPGEGWKVEAEGAAQASSVHEKKDEAVARAKQLARTSSRANCSSTEKTEPFRRSRPSVKSFPAFGLAGRYLDDVLERHMDCCVGDRNGRY